VSWQLAAFGILALGLAGGFGWYERSRPDARIVALVATLAAFAALGRIAFAALPNVKPTTDIVLISGYALGGAPGFMIGALAGLTSNFFFGQGPWTPWQMAGWGAVGLIGAGVAVITRRRISRWPLAIVCMVVGFAFTALQDVGDWVTYSDHSPAQLGVYVGKGLGFDAIHAAGCLMFALLFGPALARSIGRFATRLQVAWRPSSGIVASVAIAAVITLHALGGTPAAGAVATPTGYLLGAQNGDGGYGAAPGSPSNALYSGWAALGLAAAGYNPQDVSRSGHTLLAYVQAGSPSDPGSLERTILALRAAGAPVTSLVAALQRDVRANGSVSGQANLTAFAILALRAAGVAPSGRTESWLLRQQDSDGGFNFSAGGGVSDVDDTGAVLEALAGTQAGRARARAIAYLRTEQNGDGGFPATPQGSSNAQSTSWAVQGLVAAGVPLGSLRHGTPLRYLDALVAPDGHVRYSRSSDQTPVWVTGETLMALTAKPLPLAPVAPRTPVAHPARRSAAVVARAAPPASRRRHARAHPALSNAEPVDTLALAADVGVATALLLAPVGAG
jgi:energy-coupling factor transport system substrate-specific component